MTEKRLYDVINKAEPRGQSVTYEGIPCTARTCVTRLNRLTEENEKLKQYIYDNLDEDICDVCSYQYLEKSQMDKYYVAKCKKGYDNCSKGTVIHCKDFKFKELQE